MDFEEKKFELEQLKKDLENLKLTVNVEEKQEQINKLEKETLVEGFWQDSAKSSNVMQEIKTLQKSIANVKELNKLYEDASEFLEISEMDNDKDSFSEALKAIGILSKKIEKYTIETLFSDEYDSHNAIVTIHPGAGGTESHDWALMLYRMYTKWAQKSEFDIEVLDMQQGEEAGLNSVSFMVKGLNAYGYLKGEKGVHRLVRISPFDANSRRHTSFAGVEVLPEILDDVSVEIRPEDLEFEAYRASGAGGQHINKTSSAVRIKHIPSGIVVTCQTERSQLQNREYAMKMLKAKLYQLQKENLDKKIENIKGKVSDNAWGSQIRSYVFCPYTLVKDHRTNYETGNIQAVMDGKIDEFMYAYLRYLKNIKK